MKRPPILPVIIATGFGSGFWPWGPGTAGAVVATALWMLLALFVQDFLLMGITFSLIIFFTAIGTWATARLQPFWGNDPSRVVVDEMVGVWVPLLLADGWPTAVIAVVLFRFFDILKPLGIRQIDRRQGAFWVMADDLVAGLYSALLLWIIKHFFL